jgi:S1-C subfamily serine protease
MKSTLGLLQLYGSLACLVLAASPPANAQDSSKPDALPALVARIDRSVVVIETDSGIGSGFIVGANGVIATNYHVIEGVKKATARFADKTSKPVIGFLAISPGKDLALVQVGGADQTPALSLTDKSPAKGETVYVFGTPQGLAGSVAQGIVSAVRGGKEVSEALLPIAGHDVSKALHFDLDATWIQTTAPISAGNSGGPLVNRDGLVVGVNTWCWKGGQNLNFAIEASHLRRLVADAGHVARPLSELPPSTPEAAQADLADGDKTLAYWQGLVAAHTKFWTETKRLLPPRNQTQKQRAQALITQREQANAAQRFGNRAGTEAAAILFSYRIALASESICKQCAEITTVCGQTIQALPVEGVDTALLAHAITDVQNHLRMGRTYSAGLLTFKGGTPQEIEAFSAGLQNDGKVRMAGVEGYELLRVVLKLKYKIAFPVLPVSVEQVPDQPNLPPTKPRAEAKLANSAALDEEKAGSMLKNAQSIASTGNTDGAIVFLKKLCVRLCRKP